ncbi:hypothetical protein GW17_00010578 [Ensete ventricosum]|uniref:Uncharacterized protein n=1 Tax=Ensete ventricosum TaxID=4639 RepID=A0A444FR28_ENSVE|nr:hypothetical protein GW17_00010578 [Ensete ventricosum]RZR71100.1 hypothetical protein BHM03_00003622 [Ensete ventricosum]
MDRNEQKPYSTTPCTAQTLFKKLAGHPSARKNIGEELNLRRSAVLTRNPVQERGETNQFDAESQKQESKSIRKVRNQSKARSIGTRCKYDGILATSRPTAPKKGTRKRDYLATHREEEIGEKNRGLREEG